MNRSRKPIAVLAVGGNALIRDAQHQTVKDQYDVAGETAVHIAAMVQQGWEMAVTHGNGPQVGFILRRSELAASELHEVPLDVCVADSQGALGYALQQNLHNQFQRLGIRKSVVSIVTQTVVSAQDPAFDRPSKPIGSFMTEQEAARRRAIDRWSMLEDAGRGWRRVVASPQPRRIVEADAVRYLLDAGVVVVAAGGGGIPVTCDKNGNLQGVAAVIDKDRASSLLARVIGADLMLIATGVEKVALNWGKPNQRWVDHLTLAEARRLLAEGSHFGSSSMAPKIESVIHFLEEGGKRAIITSLAGIERALAGQTGTHFESSGTVPIAGRT